MIGQVLGPYEILATLGAGGMGEVYRARDTQLDRDVAIKVLPESFAADADRVARFTREAKTLAALNHPNIAQIYGVQESKVQGAKVQGSKVPGSNVQGSNVPGSKVHAIVMELVEGEDLSSVIARGALPLADALAIARQIADALEAAHEQGIIHRDLKPQNIKVREDGTVKVLDFGLAKAMDANAAGAAAEAMNSPTLTARATQMGVILGTAAYMAPEQARGRPVDRRADIWAFGVVLYEMLTGRRCFPGEEISDVLAAVLRQDVDFTALPADTPAIVRHLLVRCLDRDLKTRLRDIGEARIALARVTGGGTDATEPSAAVPKPRLPVGWIAACAALAVAVVGLAAVQLADTPPASSPEMRLEVSTPGAMRLSDFALAPDGSRVAFVGVSDGVSRVWLRDLDRTTAQPLTGTEGAQNPFWSPDGSSIGFFAGGMLKRIAAGGGAPTTLTIANPRFGGSWSTGGDIFFAAGSGLGLSRINASGGTPVRVFPQEAGVGGGWYPSVSPDGAHVLFLQTLESYTLYLGSTDGSPPKALGPADSHAAWLAPDRILYVLQGTLVAHHIDITRGQLVGDPETVAESVGVEGFRGAFSVSAKGPIAYRAGPFADQWAWLDRSGQPAGPPVRLGVAGATSAKLSLDGRRAALDVQNQGNRDVFLADLLHGNATRFTFDPKADGIPVWSPDGRTIAFESTRKGTFDLYLRPSDGSAAETLLLEAPEGQWPQDWSRNGEFLLYFSGRDLVQGQQQLLALPMGGATRTPIPVGDGLQGAFSPDGRWIAYQTRATGRWEIVVQAFPTPRGKWQVSTTGGTSPRWRDDGKELYFVTDTTLMAAAIHVEGESVRASAPARLFEIRDTTNSGGARAPYDVARDGRFFLNQLTDAALRTPITLILNWRGGTR